uniref:Uncharacterized protein n=1 Tax=Panagrolaimus sp. PS1159 TaxID=55785 RepID=A0AC35FF46_9BILA
MFIDNDFFAAGEVIHQPWNVEKELIENSLDAKSGYIIVSLKDGGFEEIMIRDNGFILMIKKKLHTDFIPPKLKSVDDVYKILTIGFRGYKRNGIEDGVRIVIQGKERTKQVEHHIEAGTTIVVTDIFKIYSPSDIGRSNNKITKLVTDYAYANPEIKFVLQIPAFAFRTPNLATSNQKEWIAGILG